MKLMSFVSYKFALDGGAMFGVVPKPLWSKDTTSDDKNRIPMVTRQLLIEIEDKLVLVDTGIGSDRDKKFIDIYKIEAVDGGIEGGLKKLGYQPEDVTDVIFTHLHFDHAGGTVVKKDQEILPRFTHASFHIQKRHWQWAHAPSLRDRASFISDDFDPIEKTNRLILHDGSYSLYDKIRIEVTDGHTPAHQIVIVESEDSTYLFPGDTIPMSFHIRLPYIMGYDLEPLKTLEEKKALIKQASDKGWKIIFEHDPKIKAAFVSFDNKRPVLEPIGE